MCPSEKIRLQLEEYFRTEKQNFEQKLADEEQRKSVRTWPTEIPQGGGGWKPLHHKHFSL